MKQSTILLLIAALIFLGAESLPAQRLISPCPSPDYWIANPAPTATPLQAPPSITGEMTFAATTKTYRVGPADDLQAAIDAAEPRSHILLAGTYNISVTINAKALVIEGEAGTAANCMGQTGPDQEFSFCPGNGLAAFTLTNGAQVVFRNLMVNGGFGPSDYHPGQDSGCGGGSGAPAVVINSSTAAFVNCRLDGGGGGSSGGGGAFTPGPGGGWGGHGLYLSAGSTAYAGGTSAFTGARGGSGGCGHCSSCGNGGAPGLPFVGEGDLLWRELGLMMQINQSSRSVGDFDESGLVDMVDFLLLLDYWRQPDVSPPLNLVDVFALLDHWMSAVPQ